MASERQQQTSQNKHSIMH